MPELAEVLTETGIATGKVTGVQTIHNLGLPHRDVHVWISDGRRLLQQQRHLAKSIMPGQWDISVGGHVAAGESYLQAAMREMSEELGLTYTAAQYVAVGLSQVELFFGPPGKQWRHKTFGQNFVVIDKTLSLRKLRPQPREVVSVRWYALDQLEQDLAHHNTVNRHASQPLALWQLGIQAIRALA